MDQAAGASAGLAFSPSALAGPVSKGTSMADIVPDYNIDSTDKNPFTFVKRIVGALWDLGSECPD